MSGWFHTIVRPKCFRLHVESDTQTVSGSIMLAERVVERNERIYKKGFMQQKFCRIDDRISRHAIHVIRNPGKFNDCTKWAWLVGQNIRSKRVKFGSEKNPSLRPHPHHYRIFSIIIRRGVTSFYRCGLFHASFPSLLRIPPQSLPHPAPRSSQMQRN